MAFCSLLDWFTSRKEQKASKDVIVGWYVRLDEFNYRQSMNQSIAFCNRLFDRIYGKKHFSWRCILVSYAISIMSVCLIASFTEVYQQIVIGAFEYEAKIDEILVATFVLNPLADYISLIETRLLLRLAVKGRLRYWPLWLLLDVFLTLNILMFVWNMFGGGDINIRNYLDMVGGCIYVLLPFLPAPDEMDKFFSFLRPLILSTFSTSIIFYFYCLSALAFKFLGLAKTRLQVLLQRLEESDRLFKAIGAFISACLVFSKAIIAIVQHIG